jgi:hydroxymethylpyrimidine/phosphomethylpyrimidine kinase
MDPIILSIAGSDSSGGAGIQADIKSITVQGGYAATAITAVTAQNTLGVQSIHLIPNQEVIAQIKSVIDDLQIAVVKTGMLSSVEVIEYIAANFGDTRVVVDPVMVATSGDILVKDKVIEAIKTKLVPIAEIVTPNIYEAEILTGVKLTTVNDQINAGKILLAMGCNAALIKGGHGYAPVITDVLVMQDEVHIFEHERINTKNTHGTGCTLASSIATNLGLGKSTREACRHSIDFVCKLLKNSPNIGHGNGPLLHNLL